MNGFKSLEHAIVERLSDLLLGERLPLDICSDNGDTVIIPANKIITKSLLKGVYDAHKANTLEIDPSPIRNRVLQTIDEAERQYERQLAREKQEKNNPGPEM